ncbi:cysteine--tRNA ligase [Candidatus Roizmanbacteria bacterium]|nr:cysteine--tRNA ligase [Candidatus Roizmanbacteria bacterium]
MRMKLYNTLSRSVEELQPLNPPVVTMYTCGPTVYDYTHIGHMRTYTMVDILRRTLTMQGFHVKQVMNVTDVGHLTSDGDTGEDKLEKGAKKYGKTVWEIAQFYTDFFHSAMKVINILPPDVESKATDHIPEMIELIQTLGKKGFTYETDEAIYFDVSKFSNYGKLSRQKIDEKLQAVRDEVFEDPQKKHPADFVLWFKRVGKFADHTMHWPSPWGEGFPGWHIECSAMSMKYLGESIDIHTGGIDHIPVHHENEIAQSEGATGKKFVQIWVHPNFLQVDGQKMSKSLGNFYTYEDVQKKGIEPLALRLLFLQAHYRQSLNFTWESAKGAQETLDKLKNTVLTLRSQTERSMLSEDKLAKIDEYRIAFRTALANDLQTPQAVSVMFEMLKSNIPSEDKLDLLYEFDEVLGLDLAKTEQEKIPDEIIQLGWTRLQARQAKDFAKSDELRKLIEEKGYNIEDREETFEIIKKNR